MPGLVTILPDSGLVSVVSASSMAEVLLQSTRDCNHMQRMPCVKTTELHGSRMASPVKHGSVKQSSFNQSRSVLVHRACRHDVFFSLVPEA